MIQVYGSHKGADLKFTILNYVIIGVGVTTKLILFLWCRTIKGSLSARTLAADHMNDVIMNGFGTAFAIGGFFLTKKYGLMKGGWIDPIGAHASSPHLARKDSHRLGAIGIALFVMSNWGRTCTRSAATPPPLPA